MAQETILIVEDDETMLRVLKDIFEFCEYIVRTACDGEEGLGAVYNVKPDLVILDIMLPKLNGYDLCREIRKKGLDMPIIMLTAKGQESDIIHGLNLGADDYVTKPFSIDELLARTNAFLRRRRSEKRLAYRFGEFELNTESHKLFHNGEEKTLTPKEYALLEFFVQRPNRAFTRDAILDYVWGNDITITSRSVDRCINTLRNKVEHDSQNPKYITTIRNVGYRFEIPDGSELM